MRAQVVHPLDERDDLLPLLLFGGLLDARVQVADRRRDRQDGLAVQLEHQPQHAVRAGVLRPHVDGQDLGAQLRHTAPVRSGRTSACSSVRCTSCTRAVEAAGTLTWMSAAAPTAPPSRPVSATVVSPPAFAAANAATTLADPPLQSRCRAARRPAGRAPRPGARRPVGSRSRSRAPSGSTCPSSARSPPARARSRSKRPTSSAAKCCASAALPPLPHARTRPPARSAAIIAAAAAAAGPAAGAAPPRAGARPPRESARPVDVSSGHQPRPPRRRRSFSMFARNCSSVTCVGASNVTGTSTCTG